VSNEKLSVSNLILNVGQDCPTTDAYHFDKLVSVPHSESQLDINLCYTNGGRKRPYRTIRHIYHARSHVASRFHV